MPSPSPSPRPQRVVAEVPTVESLHLDNGVWLLVMPTTSVSPGYRGVASVQLWVAAGSGAERRNEHGCAHLLEHMVFKPRASGTGEVEDLARVVERVGGDVNAYTSHDETVFHATLPVDAFAEVTPVMLASILAPDYDRGHLAREQEVVVEEIRQYSDDPAARSIQTMMADLFGEHPYARPVLGEEHEVRALRPSTLRAWSRRQFRGARVIFVVVGPLSLAEVDAVARPWLAQLPAGPRPRGLSRPQPPARARVRVVREDVQEAYLRLGWVGGAGLDDDAIALDVASVVLGQGESSRLARGVRRRQRLVSDAYVSYASGLAAGTFMVSAQTEADQAEAALEALLGEVERLGRVPVEPEELQRARALLQSSLVYRRETVEGQAHALGYFATLSASLTAEAEYFERLAALTPEAIQDACARLLRTSSAALTLILPESDSDARAARALAKRLERRCARPRGSGARLRSTRGPDSFGISRVVHSSGLRVVARVDARVPIVASWLVWPGGQRLEPTRLAGISSLSAALLNRGTSQRDGDALAREIDGLAAVLDGFSGHNSVGLQAECLREHTTTVLARMLECALDPAFGAEELDEARRLVLADLDADEDDVGHQAYRELIRTLYGRHPYARDLRGRRESLARLDSRTLQRSWARDYRIEDGVLALAGDVDLDRVLALLDELLAGRAPAQARLPGLPSWPGDSPKWRRRPVTRTLERRRAQGQCVIGFPGLRLGAPECATLDVLCAVLGGQSGRLFESLRERQGLVYQVGVSSSEHLEGGHVVFYAAASQDKLAATRAALEAEIHTIRTQGVGAEELARAKRWLSVQFETGLQRRSRIASRLVFGEAYGLGADHYLRYPERVMAVEREALASLAARLFEPRRQVTVVVQAPMTAST